MFITAELLLQPINIYAFKDKVLLCNPSCPQIHDFGGLNFEGWD